MGEKIPPVGWVCADRLKRSIRDDTMMVIGERVSSVGPDDFCGKGVNSPVGRACPDRLKGASGPVLID